MTDLVAISERVLRGETVREYSHPFDPMFALSEVADGVAMMSGFANVAAIRRSGKLTLVDVGSWLTAVPGHELIRRWEKAPLDKVVFTHGHVDHVMGLGPFSAETETRGFEVIAHRATPRRFARYTRTAGWNGCINQRQFSLPVRWPTDYPAIDRLVDERYDATLADGSILEIHHARGETDDHLWAFYPAGRVLFTGDLFIWAFPNAGNPQKVQRYPDEWAAALRAMAAKKPAVLLPGHGLPIVGEAIVERALLETAGALESIVEEVVALMNEGADLDTIIHAVKLPRATLERPYLRPIYDDPSFVVRTVWRLYGGWWDQDPATLLPAPKDTLARELADLAGGAERVRARAEALIATDLRLAAHLIEVARRAAPNDRAIRETRARIYRERAEQEPSLMAKGIFGATAKASD